ncbi:MAG: hypothetical protein QOH31_2225 [Verrucomicrobiota bacterium]
MSARSETAPFELPARRKTGLYFAGDYNLRGRTPKGGCRCLLQRQYRSLPGKIIVGLAEQGLKEKPVLPSTGSKFFGCRANVKQVFTNELNC